jgi:hypothetical protein
MPRSFWSTLPERRRSFDVAGGPPYATRRRCTAPHCTAVPDPRNPRRRQHATILPRPRAQRQRSDQGTIVVLTGREYLDVSVGSAFGNVIARHLGLKDAPALVARPVRQAQLKVSWLSCGVDRVGRKQAIPPEDSFVVRTPHRWLLERRVDRAKELLRHSSPIAEIALECGFSDQSHFTRVFTNLMGVPPGVWRRQSPHPLVRN